MYSGANFQADVAAFFAVVALAEDTASVPEPIRSVAQGVLPLPVRVGAELSWPTDDAAVWFNNGAICFVQAKASLDSSDLETSEFAGVIDQFVRQVRHGRGYESGVSLDSSDRLLLVLGEGASGRLRDDLCILLERIGDLSSDEALAVATRNETRVAAALTRVTAHIKRSLAAAQAPDDDAAVRNVLGHMCVWATSQESILHVARTLLTAFVVADHHTVDAALALLQRHFAEAGQRRRAHSVPALRALLRRGGIALREPRSIALDAARLRNETRAALEAETRVLRTREGDIRIRRAIVEDVIPAVRHGDLIITGEAGAGKSDVLIQTAQALIDAGARVVYLDAADPRMADPSRALNLQERLEFVLDRWGDPADIGYLFIDGFDSTRIGPSLDVLVRIIRRIQTTERAWHIVIASREYDLVHAGLLAEIFAFDSTQPVAAERRDQRFARYAHIVVPRLTQRELEEATEVSGSLRAMVTAASPRVRELLENPFNLSVAASIATAGAAVDLSGVRTQIDLLDLWWDRRVLPGEDARAKQRIVRDIAHEMLRSRKLRISEALLPDGSAANELLSSSVLALVGPRRRDLAFTHAIVFDYAVDRMLLADEGAMARLLDQDRDAFLFVLPAISMRFDELWAEARDLFYRELRGLFDNEQQRRTLLMIAARIPFERFRTVDDLMPLIDSDDPRSLTVIKFIIRRLLYARKRGMVIAGPDAAPWSALALELARRFSRYEHDALLLLTELTQTVR